MPLFPFHRGLTPQEAADYLRGLADFLENYPTQGVVLSVDVDLAPTGESGTKKPSRRSSSATRSARTPTPKG